MKQTAIDLSPNCRTAFLSSISGCLWLFFWLTAGLFTTPAATFEIGPGKEFHTISDVPWESLDSGDIVLIHWRPEPYKDKWVIGRSGTAEAPIIVRGVPGPDGALPVVDGNGARTRSSLSYWNESRGVIKIGGSRHPDGPIARYITLEYLDVRGGRPPNKFTSASGAVAAYTKTASAIYVERGEHITIRRCAIHDSGNGLFISSGDEAVSRDILIEHNRLFDNGNEGSQLEHNSYTAAVGIVFQFNHYGPLRAGCPGINLKDRSAGTVVRYNWIEGGNLQLSLVEGNDSKLILNDRRYGKTFVYGNILVEPRGDGLGLIARYGGDSGDAAAFRKGTLYFYNNSIISHRTDRTTVLKLQTDGESCDFRNNIVYTSAPSSSLALLESRGLLHLSHNWLKAGAKRNGKVYDDGTSLSGESPLFVGASVPDFRLAADSPCAAAAGALPNEAVKAYQFDSTYVKHQGSKARPANLPLNIGACETAPTKLSK